MSTSSVSEASDPSKLEQGVETLNPTFCAMCRRLSTLPEGQPLGMLYVSYTLEDIAEAAKRECLLCCRFLIFLESGDGIENIAGDGDFQARLYYTANHPSWDPSDWPNTGFIKFEIVGYTGLDDRRFGLQLEVSEYNLSNGTPFLHQRHNHVVLRPVRVKTALTSWTGDEAHLRTITEWIQTCEETHSACRQEKLGRTGTFVPTRLIDVSTASLPHLTTAARLSDKKDRRYITLSHRWQNEDMPKLLTSNLHERFEGIKPNELPAVFLDAIDLCQRLSVPFLWIDALCLIQDDPADCDREISSMGEIYANAFVHVGATRASNMPGTGLYTELNSIGLAPFYMDFQWDARRFSRIVYEGAAVLRINQSVLMSRGWVFQERLLSPKSIYFDDLLGWECTQLVTTELHPESPPLLGRRSSWGVDLPFKVPSLLGRHNVNTDPRTGDYYIRWLALAQSFSRCQLTYDEDALPALSGLARAFQAKLRDRYVAGIWYRDIVRSLLWIHRKQQKDSDDRSTWLEKSYRVPSWSWLSLKGRVLFLWLQHFPQLPSEKLLAHVRKVHIEHVRDDEFGKVSSGYLRLACYIRKASDRPARDRSSFDSQQYDFGSWCDDFDDVRASCTGCWFCVLQIRGIRPTSSDKNEVGWPAHLLGIILEPVDLSQQLFRRVGVFAHLWGEHNTSQFKELCPEFADVTRLEDMEQEEVTII